MRARPLLILLFLPSLFGFSEFQAPSTLKGTGGDIQVVSIKGNSGREVVFIKDTLTEVQICNLKPGETYYIQAIQKENCQPLLEFPGSGKAPQSIFNFIAGASCQTMLVRTSEFSKEGCSGAIILSYSCNTCLDKPAGEPENQTRAPISVTTSVTPISMVRDVLIGGDCFELMGITHTGSFLSRGVFNNGQSSISINRGIILSSGSAVLATGPNNTSSAGANVGGGSDIDLVIASGQGGGPVFDASVLEFDFTPTVSQITFRYVFASEEYCDFINSGVNDVFGFFISGPGINGPYSNNGINIAVIPVGLGGTTVSIDNVNHVDNSIFYVGNIPAGSPQFLDPDCQGHPVSGPPATNECQFDGFTKVLTAVANVIPCETYHIRLAIGDGGDAIYDSAVFVESNSFDAGGEVEVVAAATLPGQGITAFEGCTNGFFTFTRSSGDPALPLTINYTITGTATSGADYSPIPLSVTIPPNQTSVQIPVTVFSDLVAEGIESIIITLNNPCNCSTSTAILQISDPSPVNVNIDVNPVCVGNSVTVTPTITGGAQPFQYAWSPSGSGPVYTGFPTQPGVYSVTVSDVCGSVDSDTANIEVYTLNATISGSTTVCPGSPGYLTVNFTGPGPWSFNYQINTGGSGTVTGITQNPYQFPVTQPGNYTITSVSNSACSGSGIGVGVVTIPVINLSYQITNVECYGQSTGAIDLSVNGGTSPYTYSWSNNSSSQDLQNIPAGFYVVNVIDNRGCNKVIAALVNQPPDLTATATVLSGVDCTNPSGGSVDLAVLGGTAGYTYLWNTGNTSQDISGLTAGVYTVTVTDANDCTETVSVTIPGDASIPIADIELTGAINCINNTLVLDGSASSAGPNFTYQWTAADGGSITGDPNALSTSAEGAGTYELIVTDTLNDCFTSASIVVQPDFDLPLADSGPGQVLNCLVDEVNLDGSGSSSGPGMQYTWSTATGNFTSATNIPTPSVDAPGVYTLVVTDANNGCSDTSTVVVSADLLDPVASAGTDGIVDCTFPSIQLDASGSSAGPGFTYLWTTPDGNILDDPSLPNPTVDQAGTYNILVTNTANGCTASDMVTVIDLGINPLIQIDPPGVVTCGSPEISLDATGSDSGPGMIFNWTALNGGTIVSGGQTLTPLIGSSGAYELTITNTLTGCQSVETVDVTDNFANPVADAGAPQSIPCNLPDLQLDGSGSSSGPGFTYNWAAINGGNIVIGANTATPTIDNAGIYILTVTDFTNGCTALDSVEVILDNNAPTAVATAPQLLDCDNQEVVVNGIGSSLGSNFNYVWSTIDGNIVFGETTIFLTVNEPGTYTLTVTNDLNSCSSQTSVTLGIDTLAPLAQAIVPGLLNCAVSSIQIDGSNSSTGPEFTYNWTTTDGNILGDPTLQSPFVDQPGTYTLLVTDFANNCTSQISIDVLQDITLPPAEAGATDELNCSVTSLSLSGAGSGSGPNISYSWTTPDGNIVSGGNTLTPVVDAPGMYEITVQNSSNGCFTTDQVLITQNLTPPIALIAAPGVLTCDETTLSLDGSQSTGIGSLSFDWTAISGNIVSGPNTSTPGIDQAGNYQLVVTQSSNLCMDTATVAVGQDIALPTAEAGPTFELDCGTTSLALNGAGSSGGVGFSYSWSTADGIIVSGGNTLTPQVSAAGTYVLTVEDTGNGCTSSDQVLVTLDAASPVSDAGLPQEITCVNTSLTMDGSGSSQGADFTYSWAGPGIVSGANGLNPVVNAPGTYILTVTNLLNSCQSSSSVTISLNNTQPVAEAGALQTITCTDLIVSLDAGASSQGPNLSYLWTSPTGNIVSGANTLNPQVDAAGVYNLLITNSSNGCTATDATTVSINQTPPTIVLQTPAVLTCVLTAQNLGASGTSTGPQFDYLWTTLDGQILGDPTVLSPSIDEPGTYTLTVTNTQNGCATSQSVTVLQSETPPLAEAGASAVLNCTASTLQLNGAGSSTGLGISYQWVAGGGGVIVNGANSLTPTISAPGTYTLTVLNSQNGCTTSDIVVITQDIEEPVAVIAAPATLTCVVEELTLNATGSDSGTGFQLTWTTNGGNIVSTANILQPLIDAPGSYTLSILNLGNGCSSDFSVLVDESIDPPGANAGPDFLLHCNLLSAQLLGSSPIGGSGQYVWTTTDGSIVSGGNTPQPVVGSAGTYLLTVTNLTNGCTSADQVFVDESIPVEFDFALDQPVCLGSLGDIEFVSVLGGTAPYQYSIDGGLTFSAQTQYIGIASGSYDLVVRDANGCDLFGEAELVEGTGVEIEVDPQILVDLGQSFQLEVLVNMDPSDIQSIYWEPDLYLSCNDCLDPTVVPANAVDYTVTIVSEEGCEGEARISFRVNKQANVFVPSIFSPNGDGENDVFLIFGGNQVKEVKSFLVFNRWGESVHEYRNFQPNDPTSGWDGNHRGQAMNPAVFTWYAEIEMIDGRLELFKGSVSLVR